MWSSEAAGSRHGVPPEFFFVAPGAVPTFDPNATIGVIPLLTAALYHAPPPPPPPPSSEEQQIQRHTSSSSKKAMSLESSNRTSSCQDCGNQAKKDCSHRRCRTCCKSRGFYCSTHVKSTWVPAARRRDHDPASSSSTSVSKKRRLGGASQTTSTTPPRRLDTISGHQGGSLRESMPGQVTAPAVFRCVRVAALDDGEDQCAYQAAVRIGGHVFRGFLYEHRVEARRGLPNISDLHLSGRAPSDAPSSSSHLILHPADLGGGSRAGIAGSNYGASLN